MVHAVHVAITTWNGIIDINKARSQIKTHKCVCVGPNVCMYYVWWNELRAQTQREKKCDEAMESSKKTEKQQQKNLFNSEIDVPVTALNIHNN